MLATDEILATTGQNNSIVKSLDDQATAVCYDSALSTTIRVLCTSITRDELSRLVIVSATLMHILRGGRAPSFQFLGGFSPPVSTSLAAAE